MDIENPTPKDDPADENKVTPDPTVGSGVPTPVPQNKAIVLRPDFEKHTRENYELHHGRGHYSAVTEGVWRSFVKASYEWVGLISNYADNVQTKHVFDDQMFRLGDMHSCLANQRGTIDILVGMITPTISPPHRYGTDDVMFELSKLLRLAQEVAKYPSNYGLDAQKQNESFTRLFTVILDPKKLNPEIHENDLATTVILRKILGFVSNLHSEYQQNADPITVYRKFHTAGWGLINTSIEDLGKLIKVFGGVVLAFVRSGMVDVSLINYVTKLINEKIDIIISSYAKSIKLLCDDIIFHDMFSRKHKTWDNRFAFILDNSNPMGYD